MGNIPDFTGWSPEQIVSYCQQAAGIREKTPEEWEEYYLEQERREKAQQEYLKELYETGKYLIYKRKCPVCNTVFYTTNVRKIYDNYYKCSRYVHRSRAKARRRFDRATECEECGKWFIPKRAGAKYCCAACKQKSYRRRQSGLEQTGQNDHTQEQ